MGASVGNSGFIQKIEKWCAFEIMCPLRLSCSTTLRDRVIKLAITLAPESITTYSKYLPVVLNYSRLVLGGREMYY